MRSSTETLEICDERDIPFMVPVVASQVGLLLAIQGSAADGVKLAMRGVRAAETIGVYAGRSRWFARLAEACLIAGRIAEARKYAQLATDIAERADELGYLSSALRLRARVRGEFGDDLDGARADLGRATSIARDLVIGPAIAKCLVDRARIERRAGEAEIAEALLEEAIASFRHFGMPTWERRALADRDAR